MAEKKSREVRIQKAIADCGAASRRAAEGLIEAGTVTVNGHPAHIGQKVDPVKDIIAIDGKKLDTKTKKRFYYIVLNKPRGYVTTLSDEQGRKCVADLVQNVPERVYPVGRLDRNSEGLLLLTNDGEFANRVMHPSYGVAKAYRVTVRPDVTDKQALQLTEGVVIDGERTAPAQVEVLEKEAGRVVMQIVITEGRNRQIRKMCEAVGLEVARLKRISEGPVRLGMLQPGQWRELTEEERIALLSGGGQAGGAHKQGGQRPHELRAAERESRSVQSGQDARKNAAPYAPKQQGGPAKTGSWGKPVSGPAKTGSWNKPTGGQRPQESRTEYRGKGRPANFESTDRPQGERAKTGSWGKPVSGQTKPGSWNKPTGGQRPQEGRTEYRGKGRPANFESTGRPQGGPAKTGSWGKPANASAGNTRWKNDGQRPQEKAGTYAPKPQGGQRPQEGRAATPGKAGAYPSKPQSSWNKPVGGQAKTGSWNKPANGAPAQGGPAKTGSWNKPTGKPQTQERWADRAGNGTAKTNAWGTGANRAEKKPDEKRFYKKTPGKPGGPHGK